MVARYLNCRAFLVEVLGGVAEPLLRQNFLFLNFSANSLITLSVYFRLQLLPLPLLWLSLPSTMLLLQWYYLQWR